MADDPQAVLAKLLEHALALPEAWPDEPWDGDPVAKVGKKIFVFFGSASDPRISVKLPDSGEQALAVPGAAPTGYGLGRGGWVTVPVAGRGRPQVGVLEDWIEESYRTIAPKRLSARLD